MFAAHETAARTSAAAARIPIRRPTLQRYTATSECEPCRADLSGLQRTARTGAIGPSRTPAVPPIVGQVLQGSGRPLDAGTRGFMEARFGHDFSQVRVHAGEDAAASARAVHAAAYTVGQHIVMGDCWAAGSEPGNRLLAHELAHTIQQDRASTFRPAAPGASTASLAVSRPDDDGEIAAEAAAEAALMPGHEPSQPIVRGLPAIATGPQIARYDCSKLTYRTCTTGVYKCGYGLSGTCGWVGPSRGGCICLGADRPPVSRVLDVLLVIGLSIALLATVIAALADPEPATKLGLAGLTVVEVEALLLLLGFTSESDAGGPTASLPSETSATEAVA
jgi:hypothetical protein